MKLFFKLYDAHESQPHLYVYQLKGIGFGAYGRIPLLNKCLVSYFRF